MIGFFVVDANSTSDIEQVHQTGLLNQHHRAGAAEQNGRCNRRTSTAIWIESGAVMDHIC